MENIIKFAYHIRIHRSKYLLIWCWCCELLFVFSCCCCWLTLLYKIDLMENFMLLLLMAFWCLKNQMQHFKLFIFGSINASTFGVRFCVRMSNINQFTEYNPCLNNNRDRDQVRMRHSIIHLIVRVSINSGLFIYVQLSRVHMLYFFFVFLWLCFSLFLSLCVCFARKNYVEPNSLDSKI